MVDGKTFTITNIDSVFTNVRRWRRDVGYVIVMCEVEPESMRQEGGDDLDLKCAYMAASLT